MAGEKTEAPTPKKRDDARKKGQVAKSQELVSIGALLVTVFALRALAPSLWGAMAGLMRDYLGAVSTTDLTAEAALGLGRSSGMRMIKILLPLFAILVIATVVFNVGQSGLILSGEKLKPKFSHINPAAGAKRLFATEGLTGLIKALAKLGVVTVVVVMTMRKQLAHMAALSQEDVATATATLGKLSFDVGIRAAAALFVLAVLDFAWQRRRFLKNLRMSKEELKQENRESEGDPQIKGAIRRRRQQFMNRMMAAVPQADVVVTNPTHYAVALKYDPVNMGAPIVVAKGERLLALRIREVARKHGVPVFEEPPLARALYRAVPVGGAVPANLFHAVAEVLAWVYALRQRTGFRRATPAGAGG